MEVQIIGFMFHVSCFKKPRKYKYRFHVSSFMFQEAKEAQIIGFMFQEAKEVQIIGFMFQEAKEVQIIGFMFQEAKERKGIS